jgi:hypothetical protein
MSASNLSDDEITGILNEEDKRLHEISPHDRDEAKRIEQMKRAVKVMKIRHAQNQAEKLGADDILDKLRSEIAWANVQLAESEENPFLSTDSPSVFCQRILDEQKPPPMPVPQISVEDALSQLSKRKKKPSS